MSIDYSVLNDDSLRYLLNQHLPDYIKEENVDKSGVFEEVFKRTFLDDSTCDIFLWGNRNSKIIALQRLTAEIVGRLNASKFENLCNTIVGYLKKDGCSNAEKVLLHDCYTNFLKEYDKNDKLCTFMKQSIEEFEKSITTANPKFDAICLPSNLSKLNANQFSQLLDNYYKLNEKDKERLMNHGIKKYPDRVAGSLPLETIKLNLKSPTVPCDMIDLITSVLTKDNLHERIADVDEFISEIKDWFFSIEKLDDDSWDALLSYVSNQDNELKNKYYYLQLEKFLEKILRMPLKSILSSIFSGEYSVWFPNFDNWKKIPSIVINKNLEIIAKNTPNQSAAYFDVSAQNLYNFILSLTSVMELDCSNVNFVSTNYHGSVPVDPESIDLKDREGFVQNVKEFFDAFIDINICDIVSTDKDISTDIKLNLFSCAFAIKQAGDNISYDEVLKMLEIIRWKSIRYVHIPLKFILNSTLKYLDRFDLDNDMECSLIISLLHNRRERWNTHQMKGLEDKFYSMLAKIIEKRADAKVIAAYYASIEEENRFELIIDFYHEMMHEYFYTKLETLDCLYANSEE